MVGPLFSSDAWNNVTFTAGEVRNPKRNLPLSLALGVGDRVGALHRLQFRLSVGAAAAAIQNAPEDRVATAAVSAIFGPVGHQLMATAIMVSTFGCLNGMILSGARVYYAMALRRPVLPPRRRRSTRTITRRYSRSAIQCVWAVLLTLSGSTATCSIMSSSQCCCSIS